MTGASTSDAASQKLEKAAEFLTMAEFALDGKCYDAAVSLAVSAGINASDALCLEKLGQLPSAQDHNDTPRILNRAGYEQVGQHLARLLGLKHKAQYSLKRCTAADADSSIRRAERTVRAVRSAILGN